MAENKLAKIVAAVIAEVERADAAYPGPHSLRHMHSVLEEEYDELWDEIKKGPRDRDKEQIIREAIQVASCAICLIKEIV